jgi:hypothetical protein
LEHHELYREALGTYEAPGSDERAALYLLTGCRGRFWRDRSVWFSRGEVNFRALDSIPYSSGERMVLRLAESLYAGQGEIPLASMARVLDARAWSEVLEALAIYRGEVQ